jgi:osmoprotectant transport system ATP-binding protein
MRDGRLVQEDSPERLLAAPADDFVKDFVGNDRALKRLACFKVEDHMRPLDAGGASGTDGAAGGNGGSVGADSSVRDALSRILGQGLTKLKVTDERGEVIGSILLSDIEKLNQSGAGEAGRGVTRT